MTVLPFSSPGKFRRGNLHTHSTLSDGSLAPGEVVEKYKNAGYDFLVLSEHFVEMYDWPIADISEFNCDEFTTLLGAELHAPKTQVGELWHILATGLPKAFAAAGENESAAQLAARASQAGAYIAIAHPSWSQLSLDDGLSINCADSVEIYNHSCEVESDRGYGWYLLDQLNNLGKRLNAIATDDAHFADGDTDAFGGWVNVKSVSLNAKSLLKALKSGDFYSSQGPQIHNVDLDKTQLTINCSPVDRITVVSGTSRTVTKRGKSISQASIDLEGLNQGWLLDQPSDWFRIIIRDSAGHKAWTNPYWFKDLQFN